MFDALFSFSRSVRPCSRDCRATTAPFKTIRQMKISEISFMRLSLARVDQRMSTSFHDKATVAIVVVAT